MQREVHKDVVPLIGMQLGTDCFVQGRRIVINFLFTCSSRKLMRCCQQVLLFAALKSAAVGGLNFPSPEGISNTSSSVGYNSHSWQ
jgi:hypothetical protein